MFKIPARDSIWEINSPQIMAIMNATTDSFYKPSRVIDMGWVAKFVEKCIKDGASIIDIGGQSTRPGAEIISPKEELNNIIPLIEYIRAEYPSVLISIDTFNSQVAKEGLSKGAHIINDISCGNFDADILKIAAEYNAGYIGMHLTGNINNMHEIIPRTNVIVEIHEYFMEKIKKLSNYSHLFQKIHHQKRKKTVLFQHKKHNAWVVNSSSMHHISYNFSTFPVFISNFYQGF